MDPSSSSKAGPAKGPAGQAGGSKGSMSVPIKSAMKKTTQSKPKKTVSGLGSSPQLSKPAMKSKGKNRTVENVNRNASDSEEADFDGDSNASGFSDLEDEGDNDGMMVDEFEIADGEMSGGAADSAEGTDGEDDDEEMDTDEEIDMAKAAKKKSKKNTKKRKAPTSADTFGATLTSLLAEGEDEEEGDDSSEESEEGSGDEGHVPKKPRARSPSGRSTASRATTARTQKLATNPILALSQKPMPPSAAKISLERRAKRIIKAEKKERQDRARVRNVLEGWGPDLEQGVPGGQEWERGLRKVAQRGVVKLFNAINQASKAHPTPTGSEAVVNERKSKKEKDNILGRGGKEERLTKEGFLDMIKSGGK